MHADIQPFAHLAVALAIGMLVGVERGWHYREAQTGMRIAGLRTFSVIGLMGGTVGLLAGDGGLVLIGLSFLALAITSIGAHVILAREIRNYGITSVIASLATFLFGVMAGKGETTLAAAAAIVMAVLLGNKQPLHNLLGRLKREELTAGLKLLLISVVLLPALPNQGYGPWQAFNPYFIWLLVVLISSISFFGYVTIRVAGPRRGILFGGLFGGMASSTATTLALARIARREPALSSALAAGILLACCSMIVRMLIVSTIVHPPLLQWLWAPAAVLLAATLLPVGPYILQAHRGQAHVEEDRVLRNPVELRVALLYAALLTTIMVLGKALSQWAGSAGLWTLSAFSGLADVDAITLSLARMSSEGLNTGVAVVGIAIATGVNSLLKGTLGLVLGGRSLGLRLIIPLGTGALLALATAIWLHLSQNGA